MFKNNAGMYAYFSLNGGVYDMFVYDCVRISESNENLLSIHNTKNGDNSNQF